MITSQYWFINVTNVPHWHKMIIIGECACGVYGNLLYSLHCNSVRLKLFQNVSLLSKSTLLLCGRSCSYLEAVWTDILKDVKCQFLKKYTQPYSRKKAVASSIGTAEVWTGAFKEPYDHRNPHAHVELFGGVTERRQLQAKLQWKDFRCSWRTCTLNCMHLMTSLPSLGCSGTKDWKITALIRTLPVKTKSWGTRSFCTSVLEWVRSSFSSTVLRRK